MSSMSINASSNAQSYLQQLLQYGSSGAGAISSDPLLTLDPTLAGADSSSQPQSNTSAIGSGSGSSFEPGTLAALISLQGQSASGVAGQSPSGLFSQIDTDGDGQISQTEFEQALGAVGVDTQSADALFGKLDTNSDGSITPSELGKAQGHGHGHHHHHAGSTDSTQSGSTQQDGLSSLLNSSDITGATTQTSTNGDGSSTTTISYTDGTTVTMTTPATAAQNTQNGSSDSGSSGASSNNNLIEQLIRLQSQLVTQAASTLSTMA